MLTDAALNPTHNKQALLEVMLEDYGFQAVGMQVQAVLTLYAHGEIPHQPPTASDNSASSCNHCLSTQLISPLATCSSCSIC